MSLTFVESTHIYTLNGKEVPSVSTILGATLFKDKYSGVDEWVLKKAAEFGTAVHYAIETNEIFMLTDEQYTVYKRYLNLKKRVGLKPLTHEIRVHLDNLYAGTFDMEATIGDDMCLCDVKTTYDLDLEYISWQLSLYELASKKRYDKLYAIWTPKRKGAELREVKRRTREELEMILSMYYQKDIDLGVYYE